MRKAIILLILIVILFASCISLDEDSSHNFTIINYSSDTLSIFVVGDSIETVIDTLVPKEVDFRNGSRSIYRKMYYNLITEQYDQYRFETMIDSFVFKVKVDNNWEQVTIPSIMSLENWNSFSSSDDFILGHYYYFYITDSLLSL
jgi:hypothetical protein